MKLEKNISSQIAQFLDKMFLDTLFKDSQKLFRVARWLSWVAWLALITIPLIISNNVLFFINMQSGLPRGLIWIGNNPKPILTLSVMDILEILGHQIEGTLEPVVFWLGIFLLMRLTRHILYLVFDIKNAAKPHKLIRLPENPKG